MQTFQQRKDEAEQTNDVLHGHFRHLVEERLRASFNPETYGEMRLGQFVSTTQNVLVNVLNKLDVTWESGAKYLRTDDPAWEAWARSRDYDALGRLISRLKWLHRGVLAITEAVYSVRENRTSVVTTLLTPDVFDLVVNKDNARDYDAVILYPPGAAPVRVTPNTYTQGRAVTENPYGVIPAVFINGGQKETLWGHGYGPTLVESTIQACVGQSMINHQSTGQIKFLVGQYDERVPGGQYLAHGRPVIGPMSGWTVMDLQTDLQRQQAVLVDAVREQAERNVNLRGKEFDSAVPQSGVALRLQQFARDRLALSRRPWIVEALLAIIQNELIVARHLGLPGVPADGPVEIIPHPLEYPETQQEVQEREKYELAGGYVTREELLQRRHPTYTLDEARAYLARASTTAPTPPDLDALLLALGSVTEGVNAALASGTTPDASLLALQRDLIAAITARVTK